MAETKKIHVGKFKLTDKHASFTISAKVEVDVLSRAIFFLNHTKFASGSKDSYIMLSSIDMRSIALSLERAEYTEDTIIYETRTRNSSFSIHKGESKYLLKIDSNTISIEPREAIPLASEIILLVNMALESCYKTQQYQERKKLKTQEKESSGGTKNK